MLSKDYSICIDLAQSDRYDPKQIQNIKYTYS